MKRKKMSRYKYIHLVKIKEVTGEWIWSCKNNKNEYDELGWIEWYKPWKQYCFCPATGTVFSGSCLADIIDFIKQLGELKEKPEGES